MSAVMNSRWLAAGCLLLSLSAACAGCTPADASLAGPSALTPLRGTEWTLVALNGTAVTATANPPTLTLDADGGRASGFAGCNRFSGSYTASADALQLTNLAMTRMFCFETMDLEREYVAALEAARTYRLDGSRLELFGAGRTVAALEKR